MSLADLVEMSCRASDQMTVIPDQNGWGPDDLRNREEAYSKPWSVRRRGDRFEIALRDEPHDRNTPLAPTLNAKHVVVVDALAAALWRLCVELPDGTKTCTSCPPTRGPMLFESGADARAWVKENHRRIGWPWPSTSWISNGNGWGLWMKKLDRWAQWEDVPREPCDTCGDTRIVPRPTGDILIGAVPRLVEHWYSTPDQRAFSHRDDGDPGDRENLAVLADGLMQNEDPLGEWLSLWLGGVKCRQCRGRRVISVPVDNSASDPLYMPSPTSSLIVEHRPVSCPHCHGTSLELGAREQAIAERLDVLTWIRDRMPAVGDEIEAESADGFRAYGLVSTTEPVRLLDRDASWFEDCRVLISTAPGYAAVVYWSTVKRWRHRVAEWISDRLPEIGRRVELREAVVFPNMLRSNVVGEVVSIEQRTVTARVGAGTATAMRDGLEWRPVPRGRW